jgi:hypothetical protein
MTQPLVLLPSAEREVSALLRRHPEVIAAVEDRVYTVLPKKQTFPLVLVQLINSSPRWMQPYWIDEALLQISAYADSKPIAAKVAEICRATAATWEGRPEDLGVDGFVGAMASSTMFWNPDDLFQAAKPRYTFDLEVRTRPAGSPG